MGKEEEGGERCDAEVVVEGDWIVVVVEVEAVAVAAAAAEEGGGRN